ncbi:hypothetical protein DY703_25800, partial [Salmonella enterica]|nr:hypothetical protein [Salmonella enterica]
QRFFETDSTAGVNTQYVKRLRASLRVIDQAAEIDDINISGYRLHQLQGDRAELWSVTVSGNWRIFRSPALAGRICPSPVLRPAPLTSPR